MGDYTVGTKLEPVQISINFDPETGEVGYVGIGYHLLLPSGKRIDSGYRWHCPSDGVHALHDHVTKLQEVVKEIWAQAERHEGLSEAEDTTTRRPPLPAGWTYVEPPQN